MERKSAAQPSKQVLDQIVNRGRGCIGVTIRGQARLWNAFRLSADETPEGTKRWEVRLVEPWSGDVLATYDVLQSRDGYVSCLAEGWETRMVGVS